MLKKFLSLSLVITMILTLGMTAVFADGETTTTVISSNTFDTGTLSGLGGKEANDNSQAVTSASYHANYIYQSYKTGYFTFEFSVLGVDTTDYKLTGTIYSSDLRSDNKNERVSKEFVAELPKLNEWHRVAFEFYRDENATTPKATVKFYVDGVQVSAVALSELPFLKVNELKATAVNGTIAVDDMIFYQGAYDPTSVKLYKLAEGISLNKFTNELIYTPGEKVSDIKADIVENENVTKKFYKDSTFTTELSDTDTLSDKSIVVLTDGAVYNYIALSYKNVVKTATEQKLAATTAGTIQTDQVTTVYSYAPYTSTSTTEIDGYITVEADVLFSGASDINFKVQTKNASGSSPIYGDPFVTTALDEDEFGGNKYHRIAWEFYGDIDGTTKSQLKIYIDGKLYASKTSPTASTYIQQISMKWTPDTQDSYIHLKNLVAYEAQYKVDNYKIIKASDVFLAGTATGLGGKETGDNSSLVSNTHYNNNLPSDCYTGYTTLEFSALGIDTTAYTLQYSFSNSVGYKGDINKEFSALNKWHRVAFEHYSDGESTTTIKIYVDGALVHEGSAKAKSAGGWMRIITTGNMAIDDMILYQGAYNYNGVSFGYTDNEKVSYDEENNKFLFVNGATVDELTSAISDFDGNITVYSDSTCTTKLTDTDVITNTCVAVLRESDNNDVFRYVDIRIDDFVEFTYTNNEKIEYISDEALFIYKSGATVADLKSGFVSENGTTIEAYENENATVAMADEALITDDTVVKFTSQLGYDSYLATVKGKLSYYNVTFENDETVAGNAKIGKNGETSAITYESGLYGKTSASKAQVTTLTSLENSEASVTVPVLPYTTPSNPDAVTTTEFSFAFKGGDTSYNGSAVNLQIQGAFNRTMADGTNDNIDGTSLWSSFNDKDFKHERWNKVSITIYPEARTYTTRINGKIFRENVVITDTETDVVNKFGWLSVVVSAEAKEGEQTVNTVALDDVICYYGDFRETDKEIAQIALKDGTEAGLYENVIYIDSDKQFRDTSAGEYPLLPVSGSKISSYIITDGIVDYSMNANGIFEHDMVVVAESIDGTTLKYYDIKVPEAVYGDISLMLDGEYTGTLAAGIAGAEVTAYYPIYKAESAPTANLYLAIYSGNRLVELIEDADTKTISGETVFSVSKNLESIDGLTVKAIFINDDLKSLSNSRTFR